MKSILVIIAVLLLAGGAYLVYPNFTEAPPLESGMPVLPEDREPVDTTGEASPDVVITYTEKGYVPTSVSIKTGQTVRFTNNAATESTWPASAVHPTHGVYPEKSSADCLGSAFDSCRGLKPGESWDFRFNVAGEWRYHDHIHASKTGVVKVTE